MEQQRINVAYQATLNILSKKFNINVEELNIFIIKHAIINYSYDPDTQILQLQLINNVTNNPITTCNELKKLMNDN